MKKFTIFLIALLIISGACQRSQFSTTTRHSRNGRVTYVNHYPAERTRSPKGTIHKNHSQGTEAQNNILTPGTTNVKDLPVPVSREENLVASTSNEPVILVEKDYRVTDLSPDTTKSTKSKKRTANDSITQQVIKFKNGHKETVKIIYQSHDTLKYELIAEPGVVRSVMMDQVDSILQVKYLVVKEKKEKVVDTRKKEPLGKVGFIFSIIGFLPVIGIPFSLLAIVFGAVSLHKIHRYPNRFKGKGLAKASLILGIIAIVGYGLLIILVSAGGGFGGGISVISM
jgi:hypothetical protein